MEIYHDIISPSKPLALALGFFDGLHRGHLSVIKNAAAQKANGLLPAVFTFKSSPQSALSGKAIPRLITNESRTRLMEESGIELLYEIDFDSVRDLSAEDFVKRLICGGFSAKKVFCGFNYHFGKGGAGDEKTLHSLCADCGISAFTAPPVIFGGKPISSTRIRLALESGNVKDANAMLGRRFSFDFTVRHGNELGRKMETPTINQQFPSGFILPRFGVYAAYAVIDGRLMKAVTNIGVKPTVGSDRPLAETWILDGGVGSLYGKSPRIELVEFIRPEKKFGSIDELQNAIIHDGETAKNILEKAAAAL